MFIFGLRANEINALRCRGYDPRDYYNKSPVLKKVIDLIASGFFSPEEPKLFLPLYDSLLKYGDHYMVMADFDEYARLQKKVELLYKNDPSCWTRMSILNVARTGAFSSDRTINEYASEIWKAQPADVQLNHSF
jgi:starch phosphorylase